MKRLLRRTAPALAVLLAMSPLAAPAIDLAGAYEQALQHDATLRAATAALDAGREKAVQGRALLKPQVGLSAGLAYADDRTRTELPPPLQELAKPQSNGAVHQVALQLRQPLYDARSSAEKRQLQQQSELAEIRHREAQQDLIQRVGRAYFGVLLAAEQLQVVQAEKAAVAAQRERTQARYEVGRGKVTELQEAQARYDAVVARELAVRSQLALREAQFSELTGAAATGLAALRPGLQPPPPAPADLHAWQLKGVQQHPRVLARHSELRIAGAEIEKYKLAGRPTLDFVAGWTLRGQQGGLSSTIAPDGQRTAQIGLQFSLPLYTGGGLDSKLRESVARQQEAEHALSAAQRDTRLQVQDAWLAVDTGAARIAALEQSTRSAATSLEATTLGRDLGTRTDLDVLDAQQRLYATRVDLAQARHDHLLGRLQLAAAAGELEPRHIAELNLLLER